MKHIFIGIIGVAFGCYVVLHRSQWAHKAIEFQNTAFKFHFGKKDVQVTTVGYLLVGSAFVILGILALLGIVEPKW